MHVSPRRRLLPAILCALALAVSAQAAGPDKKDKPNISVKVSPIMGFSPARMVLTADLKGGADDYQDFYCASVEWDWGDDTRSESKTDCEPYEAGKSEIRRRFTVEHQFRRSGGYKVYFRLKKRDKPVAAASATVQIQPGAGEQRFQ